MNSAVSYSPEQHMKQEATCGDVEAVREATRYTLAHSNLLMLSEWVVRPGWLVFQESAKPLALFALILIIFFLPCVTCSRAQSANESDQRESAHQAGESQDSQAPSPTTAKSQDDKTKKEEPEGQQTKRMLWVVPNFGAVSANTQLPSMSTHDKFVLASRDSVTDYSSYTWAAILTEQAMLLNSDPELGHGIAGYGRYYWRTFTDGVSGTFFTEAIVPSITHEDPRYYTMGKGGFFRRTGYAISCAFVTKTDSGGTTFNWSEVGGNGLEAALSNAYYPPQERGINQTAVNWGTQMESAVLNHVFQEFWPDIRKKVFRAN